MITIAKWKFVLRGHSHPMFISWVTLCYEIPFTYDIMLNTKSDVVSMLASNVNRMLIQSYVNIEYPTKHKFLEEKCNVMEFISCW